MSYLRRTARMVAVCASMALSAAAFGQDEPSNADLLRDYIHFSKIAKYDVAASYARQLLDKGLSPTEFVDLVEQSGEQDRFLEVVQLDQRNADIQDFARRLAEVYESGKLARVRDPREIAESIAALTGTALGRNRARERLVAAGEYAMPQLLSAFLNRSPEKAELRAEIQVLMIDMGRQAIIPLCTALPHLDPIAQESVVNVLGLIPYPTSLPFLHDLRTTTRSDNVRVSTDRSIARLPNRWSTSEPPALYTGLGETYYDEKLEVTSFPREGHQILWAYDPGIGLVATAIATPVFHEAMAMRMTERSLALRPDDNLDALSLWIASNFSREVDTPPEYQNPAYPPTRRDAMYFAVAAGATPSQQVLARALDDRDTPLARRSIAAIERTAGGETLWSSDADRRPLLEALQYPNRRVRYEAALALAAAQPSSPFEGSERVVPTLASAIRDAGAQFAVVVTGENDSYGPLRAILERLGYTVLPAGRSLSEIAGPIAQAPGIDLIVSALPAESTSALIEDARRSPQLLATPILALTSNQGYLELGEDYSGDAGIAVRQIGLTPEEITNAINGLVDAASGGSVSAEEARSYTARSLAVLRDLAVSGNPVLDAGDAALPLITALADSQGGIRLQIADILARIDQQRAQVAVMDAAFAATGEERILLMGKTAESAKRFGNLLDDRQVRRVIETAKTGAGAEATAAAALMGALNLANTDLVPLILEKR